MREIDEGILDELLEASKKLLLLLIQENHTKLVHTLPNYSLTTYRVGDNVIRLDLEEIK